MTPSQKSWQTQSLQTPSVCQPRMQEQSTGSWCDSHGWPGAVCSLDLPQQHSWEGGRTTLTYLTGRVSYSKLNSPKRTVNLEGFNAVLLYFYFISLLLHDPYFSLWFSKELVWPAVLCSLWQGLVMTTGISSEGANPSSFHLMGCCRTGMTSEFKIILSNGLKYGFKWLKSCHRNYLIPLIK